MNDQTPDGFLQFWLAVERERERYLDGRIEALEAQIAQLEEEMGVTE